MGPGGMTSSEARVSQRLKVLELAGPARSLPGFAEAQRPAPAAAPERRARGRSWPRGKQGARPPITAEPLSVHPSPQVPNRESLRISGGSGQAAPGRGSLAPCLPFSLLDLEPRAGARAAAPAHWASQRPGLRPAGIGGGKALTCVAGSVPLRPLTKPGRRFPAQPSSKKKSSGRAEER